MRLRKILAALAAPALTLGIGAALAAAPAANAASSAAGGLIVRPSAGAWSAAISQAKPAGQMQAMSDYSFASFSGSGNLLTSGGAHNDEVYTTSGNSGDLGWSFTSQGGGLYYMHPSDNSGLCVTAISQDGGVFYYVESCPAGDPDEAMQETGSDPSTHLYWPVYARSGEACLGSNGNGDVASGQTCGSEGSVEWDRIPYN